ncbi:MAG: type II toxin-antitoxin system PemK/MazF family toxin [Candidatus Thiodiazotropha endolucinida]
MGLQVYPGPWRIMMCDFNTGFKIPEMVKRRPVITISKRRDDEAPLCTVIPISTVRPEVIRDYHYLLPTDEMPRYLRSGKHQNWVKVDMVTTVAFFRLTLLWYGRDAYGNRVYQTRPIADKHKAAISHKIAQHLAIK